MLTHPDSFATLSPVGVRPIGGLSSVAGSTDIPLSHETVYELLCNAAKRYPGRLAVVFKQQGIRWTWSRFLAEVDAFAAGLSRLGLVQGDRVAIWSPNRIEWLITQFATARMGLILVNINPAYRVGELAHAMRLVEVRAIVAAERLRDSMYLDMLEQIRPELPALQVVIGMIDTVRAGVLRFCDVLADGHRNPVGAPTLDCHDPINIQFTSGTTGKPKGATLTHHNIVNNARFTGIAMNFSSRDTLCIPVPLYHCFGMVMGVLMATAVGGGVVFPGEIFDEQATLAAVAEERCTALHSVPTMFITLLSHLMLNPVDVSSLRTGIMGGAPCPIETLRQLVTHMGMREISVAYGMTETSPVSFQSAPDDPLELRVTTVGRVQPHLQCKIVDTEGNTVPVGVVGEIWTKGYSVMRGYWNDEARTREAIVDGWMRTGDLGTIDAEGYCCIAGRLSDVLIRGGENIYPREIEDILYRHAKVQAVQVFGVPDSKYGEEVCAWVVTKPGVAMAEDEVRDFCRDHMAHYKVPKHVRFVPELPMTVTGKAQKFVMRQRMLEEFDTQRAA
jgi:fatty-acyl-CoA synthase